MKNKLIILSIALIMQLQVLAQSTTVGNNFAAANFLGWNNTNGVNPLPFRTNDIFRMRLNGNQTATINTFNVNTSGFWYKLSAGQAMAIKLLFTSIKIIKEF
ncbi:MAG: hypothetical protein ACT4ON_16600 [Bacteroidota bacterium]